MYHAITEVMKGNEYIYQCYDASAFACPCTDPRGFVATLTRSMPRARIRRVLFRKRSLDFQEKGFKEFGYFFGF